MELSARSFGWLIALGVMINFATLMVDIETYLYSCAQVVVIGELATIL
jgi:hypothetical protein